MFNFHSLNNFVQDGLTFPCYYSQMNPWIVLSSYNEWELSSHNKHSLIDFFKPRDEEVVNIAYSLLIPNLLFVLSLVVLIYWYCPYCQAKCNNYHQAELDDKWELERVNALVNTCSFQLRGWRWWQVVCLPRIMLNWTVIVYFAVTSCLNISYIS